MPDPQRFLAELEAHKKLLYKVAYTYGASTADQRDLTQEIVLQLWRSFDQFDSRSKFSTWMYRVALNVAISYSRDQQRRSRRSVLMDEAVLETLTVEPDARDVAGNLGELKHLLGQLGQLERALILLFLEGHDHEAIADILGISVSNVGTKLGRIKQRLREQVEDKQP